MESECVLAAQLQDLVTDGILDSLVHYLEGLVAVLGLCCPALLGFAGEEDLSELGRVL